MPAISQSPVMTGRINRNCLLRRNVQVQPYGRCTVCTLQLRQCHAWQSSIFSYLLASMILAVPLVPSGWPLSLLSAVLLAVVVVQGMVNHRRTDDLIYGQHRLMELTDELKLKQAVIENQNSSLAALVEARTAELRDANVRLAAANLELLETDRLRTAVLSNVSHELRTPLTGILGSAQNLRDGLAGGLTQPQVEYVAMIESDSGRLIRVVNELLEWGRLDAGKIQLQCEPVGVRSLAEEVIVLLRPAAESKAVAIELMGDDLQVSADADKLKQVLINLLDNAVKFTVPRSTVTMKIARDAGHLRLMVEDQGGGIDARDAPHLFERFYRGRSSENTAGSGLGLAIARNLARLHGGDIAVESTTQHGSAFVLHLPGVMNAS